MLGKDVTGPMAGKAGSGGQRGGVGAGPAGYCICPKCGERVSHEAGLPCTSLKSPKCGFPLIRGSEL